MGSRSKKIMNLIYLDSYGGGKENIMPNEETTSSDDQSGVVRASSNKETGHSNDQRAAIRFVSRSSSSSSSSFSSSSSSSPSFYEDSDDSVKDPNYENTPGKNLYIEDSDMEEDMSPEKEILINSEIGQVSVSSQNNICNQLSTINKSPSPSIIPAEPATHLQSTANQPLSTSQPPLSTISPETNINQPESNTEQLPSTTDESNTPTKRGRKRQRNEEQWKKNIAKRLRNCGKSYSSSKTNKTISERDVKEACKESYKIKFQTKISDSQRLQINHDYWDLGSIDKQWTFIANSVEMVVPKYRFIKMDSDGKCSEPKRKQNNAFYFTVSGMKIRVCKLFFANTLGINNRPIDTALGKKNKSTNISVMKDYRGCHGKQPKVDENIKIGIKEFIDSIPKIESHYTRANSKRMYIDGSKTVADLHRDYVELCKKKNSPFGNYILFYRVFTQDFNISFFTPKKDLCELCEIYKNCNEEEKESKKETYEKHLKEKTLSREEKSKDKTDKSIKVAVYDLQTVHQCPKGEISVFYYKSKLNVLNLSIYDLHTNDVQCYVWDESNANQGVNEIGTCVFKYLEDINNTAKDLIDVVFYSDNCAGQQKNKFMIAVYMCALQKLPKINSVTHKYLIKGHTQNEGDSAHSQIEKQVKRQLRSGPMYTPDAFIGAIKAARKKNSPFRVSEMSFRDFYDWKTVCTQMGVALQKDDDNNLAKIGDIKVIKLLKDEPRAMYFKKSYEDEEYKRAIVIKRKKEIDVVVSKAYDTKPGISERKKTDLMVLVEKNVIPSYYRPFYESL